MSRRTTRSSAAAVAAAAVATSAAARSQVETSSPAPILPLRSVSVSDTPDLTSPSSASASTSTSTSCSHNPTTDHLLFLHQAFPDRWSAIVALLRPLADYYSTHIWAATRSASAASSSPTSDRSHPDEDDVLPHPIWFSRSLSPTDASISSLPPAPASTGRALVSLLRSVLDSSELEVDSPSPPSFRSFMRTVEDGLHEEDRRHFYMVILPFLAHRVVSFPELLRASSRSCCVSVLRRGAPRETTLSCQLCTSIVALQFFSLIPASFKSASDLHDLTSSSSSKKRNNNVTTSRRSSTFDADSWPDSNMWALLSVQRGCVMPAKHMMILNYFARCEDPNEGIPERQVTFYRRVLSEEERERLIGKRSSHKDQTDTNDTDDDNGDEDDAESAMEVDDDDSSSIGNSNPLSSCSTLQSNCTPLSRVSFHSSGCIEEATHALQVDFANKYIGGGVLYTGCVQEEIRFSMSPECLVSMVLAQSLLEHEALILVGVGTHSHYGGYGSTLCFGSDAPSFREEESKLGVDEYGRLRQVLTAIDAIDYGHGHGHGSNSSRSITAQFSLKPMRREMLKAYVGFAVREEEELRTNMKYADVATGNWGCGAFMGFLPLKFLLQWMATSLASRSYIYYSFGNEAANCIPDFVKDIERMNGDNGNQHSAAASAAASTSSSSSSSPAAASSSTTGAVTVGELWSALCVVASNKYVHLKLADLNPNTFMSDVLQCIRDRRSRREAQQGGRNDIVSASRMRTKSAIMTDVADGEQ